MICSLSSRVWRVDRDKNLTLHVMVCLTAAFRFRYVIRTRPHAFAARVSVTVADSIVKQSGQPRHAVPARATRMRSRIAL